MEKKAIGIAHNINVMCTQAKVGRMEFAAKIHVYT